MPVKIGFSLSNYYELNTGTSDAPVYVDNKFGYFSIAGLVTVPLGGTTQFRRVEPARRRRVPGARRHHQGVQRRRRLAGHRLDRPWIQLLKEQARARHRLHSAHVRLFCYRHRLRRRVRSADEVRDVVSFDHTIGLLVSVALLAYLVFAMLRPEKF